MSKVLQFTDEVIFEMDEAISYYKEISDDLGADLQQKITNSLKWIENNFETPPTIRSIYRKVNLERFPYKIIYKVKTDVIIIVAFQHHKRRPFYWRGR